MGGAGREKIGRGDEGERKVRERRGGAEMQSSTGT